MEISKEYSSNVFINCPFDKEYKAIFESIVFTIHDCGFIARCAKEEDNSGDVRIHKIFRIINECKFGIHDISKADLDSITGLARFNMPLELGIFLACQHYSNSKSFNKEKKSLIMDIENFRYQIFMSDLSGQDIKSHNNKIELVIQNVRDFLVTNSKRTSIAGGEYIYNRYLVFKKDLPLLCYKIHKDCNTLTFIEYCDIVSMWIKSKTIS